MKKKMLRSATALVVIFLLQGARADLFVSDQSNNEVQRFDQITGAPQGNFVPSGQPYSANQPTGLTFGPDGNLYVVATGNGAVLRYDGNSGAPLPSMPGPPGPITNATFSSGFFTSGAQGITFGPSLNPLQDLYPEIYVTNANNVSVFDGSTGVFIQNFTLVTPATPSNPTPSNPSFTGITVGLDGNIYVSDINGSPFNNTGNGVVKLNLTTGMFTPFVATGSNGLAFPTGLTFGPDGNLYVASQGQTLNGEVLKYNGITGAAMGAFVPSNSNGGLRQPQGVVFGPDGNLYVTSFFHSPPTGMDSGTTSFVARYNGVTGAFMDYFAQGTTMDGFFGLAFSNVVAVPEPSTYAVGAGLFAFLLWHFIRSRRRICSQD